jgi:hypothetical protein
MSDLDRAGADVSPTAECRLDLTGLRDQRRRYRELGRHVDAMDRRPATLRVRFGPGLDVRLLDETLAVERECCPFYRLDYDPASRRLSVSVERPEQEPALDAIAHTLTS